MKILVTGATGFIGKHLIPLLTSFSELEIIASAKTTLPNHWKGVTAKPWDLSTPPTENLFDYFQQPDVLIHLAWQGLPDYKNKVHEEVYLREQMAFLDHLIQGGLKKILVTGTCLEYGLKEGCLDEEMRCMPTVSYAKAKNDLYQYLSTRYPQLALSWLRLFYVFGPGQYKFSLLSQLEEALKTGNPVFNMSPGDQIRDFIPVEEVVDIIARLAISRGGAGVVNISSGKPITVKDFVLNYLQRKEKTITLNTGFYPYPDYEPRAFWGNRRKLNMMLANEEGKNT
jgi:nucleoside-diphosphate-sugar epimerase